MPTYQFSHDGKYLAYSKETNLYLYNLSSSVHVQVSKSFSSAIAFSYDCNWLAFADESGGIHVFDIRSGNVFVSFSNVSGKNDLICGIGLVVFRA